MSDVVVNLRSFNLFWLEIMKEHAIFIYSGLPHEKGDLLEKAKRFEVLYKNEYDQWKNTHKSSFAKTEIAIHNAISLTEQFLSFKLHLLELKKTCKLEGSLFPLQLDHVAREAQEYLLLLKNSNLSLCDLVIPATISKVLFWVGIMGDHASFVDHLLDPTEQNMICVAQNFAKDYYSLLPVCNTEIGPITNNSLTGQIFTETINLRNWKAELTQLKKECRLLAIVPPLFFDHLKREADFFLTICQK
ncbi:MAG: DUF2935 domain-containing protein [Desulfitobacteriaceae bacterium]|nr:DUF2935 domain-containing protein [Desulfitobacteriaceae bacterium]MDD4402327.1 DUF2935 domain-containing protein [Desulfitobacteriaceae bacterium]